MDLECEWAKVSKVILTFTAQQKTRTKLSFKDFMVTPKNFEKLIMFQKVFQGRWCYNRSVQRNFRIKCLDYHT